MNKEVLKIPVEERLVKTIVLRPEGKKKKRPLIFWIHGGGYMTGMASLVYVSCGKMLGERFGAIVASPKYTLSFQKPYPAALMDCYKSLEYFYDHHEKFGIDKEKIVVGGESAGGGLAAAVCLYARDQGKMKIAMQLPLYPMLDCEETSSSRDNHGKVWNSKRNRKGWKYYLGDLYGKDVPAYASPARAKDYHNLPCCYTYVLDGEPFYQETLDYVRNLQRAGVKAKLDVYHGDVHAFDMLLPWTKKAKQAKERLCEVYSEWMSH